MTLIIVMIVAIYLVVITWVWHSFSTLEKTKRIAFLFVGILIVFLITLAIFEFSKNGIVYQNQETQSAIKNLLVGVFTGLNSLILLPFLAKTIEKKRENEIDEKQMLKRIILMIVIFLICLFLECGYMKDTQQGILTVYDTLSK